MNSYPTFAYDPSYFSSTDRMKWVLDHQTEIIGFSRLINPVVVRKSMTIPNDIPDPEIAEDALKELFDKVILTTMLAIRDHDNGKGRHYIVRVVPGRLKDRFRLVGVAYQI